MMGGKTHRRWPFKPTSPRRGEVDARSAAGEGARHTRVGTDPPHPTLSPPGRGLIRAVPRQEQFLSDRLEHAFRVTHHLVVPESQHFVTKRFDRLSSWSVDLGRVVATIQFDDQSCGAAGEVCDVRTNWELADEFSTLDASAAQMIPQPVFGIGASSPQLASDWSTLILLQRRTPSPRRGEGASSARRGRSSSSPRRGEAARLSRAGEAVLRIRKSANA
jgi:hypothetical protein